MSNTENLPKLLNINGLVESAKVVKACLNKALKSGAFDNLDEVYLSKIACDNLETSIQSLNFHQTKYIDEQKKGQEQSSPVTETD